MALWRVVVEGKHGREERIVAAANERAARERAERFARARDERLVEGPWIEDPEAGEPELSPSRRPPAPQETVRLPPERVPKTGLDEGAEPKE